MWAYHIMVREYIKKMYSRKIVFHFLWEPTLTRLEQVDQFELLDLIDVYLSLQQQQHILNLMNLHDLFKGGRDLQSLCKLQKSRDAMKTPPSLLYRKQLNVEKKNMYTTVNSKFILLYQQSFNVQICRFVVTGINSKTKEHRLAV